MPDRSTETMETFAYPFTRQAFPVEPAELEGTREADTQGLPASFCRS